MTEEQIAKQVAQNITKEEHIPGPYETGELKDEPGESAFKSNVELDTRLTAIQLADYFDISRIDRYNEEIQKQMGAVYQYAAEIVGSQELDKVLPIIQALENEIGATFTPDKLQRLAKFVRLKKQSDVLRAQMEALYG